MKLNRNTALMAAVLASVGAMSKAYAVTPFVLQTGGYVQNFNQLATGLPIGWGVDQGATATSLGTTATQGFTTSATTSSWGSTTGGFYDIASSSGNVGTEASTVQAAEANRALGIKQSSATGLDPGASVQFTIANTLGLSNFTLNFAYELLNDQGRTTTFTVDYGIGASPTTFSSVGTFIPSTTTIPGGFGSASASFNFGSALNGLSSNVVIRISALTGTSGSGSRDMVGIDDYTLGYSGTVVNVFRNLTWTPPGSTWDTGTSMNWNDGTSATTFNSSNDTVNFTDSGLAAGSTVTISGTVLPANVNVLNSSGTYTFIGGSIGGSAALIKSGSGTLNLSSTNAYSGGTTINGGVVIVNGDSTLGATNTATTSVAFNSGIMVFSAPISNGTRSIAIGTGPTTFDTNGNDVVLGKIVAGAGAANYTLIKSGVGTLTASEITSLAFADTFLTINAGAVNISSTAATSFAFIAPPGGGALNGDLIATAPVGLRLVSGTLSGTGNVKINSTGALLCRVGTDPTASIVNTGILLNATNAGSFVTNFGVSNAGQVMTISGVISGKSDVNFAYATTSATTPTLTGGGGMIILNTQASYTGNTTFNGAGGGLQLGVTDGLPTTTTLSFGTTSSTSTGVFDLHGFNQTVASLSSGANAGAGTVITNGAASTTSILTVGTTSGTTTYGGGILDGTDNSFNNIPIALVKVGNSTQVLTGGPAVNAFTGGINVNGGNLRFGTVAGQGGATSDVSINTGGTLSGFGSFVPNPNTSAGGNVTVNGGKLSPGDGVTVGSLTMQSLAVNSGSTLAFRLDAPGNVTAFDIVTGSFAINGTANSSFTSVTATANYQSGTYKVVSYAPGSFSGDVANLTLPTFASSSFTWNNDIADGFLFLNVTTTLGPKTWTGANAVANVATWSTSVSDTNWTGPGTFFTNGDAVVFDDSVGSGATTVNISGTVIPSSITFNNTTHDYLIEGGSISGNTNIVKNGGGVLKFTNTSVFFGTIFVNAGTLAITANGSVGNTTNAIVLSGGATLRLDAAVSPQLGYAVDISGSGIIDSNGFNNTLGVSGTGSFTKIGAGTLTLLGGTLRNNSSTTVNAGTLAVNDISGLGTNTNTTINAATIQLNGGTSPTSFAGTALIFNTGSTFIASGNVTYSAVGSPGNAPSINPGALVSFQTLDANSTLTISTAMRGSADTTAVVTVSGLGKLVLGSGATATDKYSGNWVIQSSTVSARNVNSFGSGNVALNGGTVALDLGTASTFASVFTLGGGTLVAESANHTFSSLMSLAPSTTSTITTTDSNGTTPRNFTAAGGVMGLSGNLTVNSPGSTAASSFIIGAAGPLQTGAISVADYSTVLLASSRSDALLAKVASISVTSANASFNIGGNPLIISSSTVAAVDPLLKNGYNGGAWTGLGGITSAGVGAGATVFAIDGADYNALTNNALFHGQTVLSTDIVMGVGKLGDITLSGNVNIDDYLAIDRGFKNPLLQGYANGDLNYDGTVNGLDYAIIDAGYALGPNSAGELSELYSLHSAEFGEPYIEEYNAILGGAIPEPASLMLLGVGAAGLLRRRRR